MTNKQKEDVMNYSKLANKLRTKIAKFSGYVSFFIR